MSQPRETSTGGHAHGSLFAAYAPASTERPRAMPAIEPLSDAWVDACAALAAAREGDPVEHWRPVFERRAAAASPTTFVAQVDDKVVGYASMSRLSPTQDGGTAPGGWYLTGLVIAPEWRRRGIGAALTRHRLAVLAEATSEVHYFASALNLPTIDLHARFGFQEIDADVRIPGVTFAGGTGLLFRVALDPGGSSPDTVGR